MSFQVLHLRNLNKTFSWTVKEFTRGFQKSSIRASDLEIKTDSNGIRSFTFTRPQKKNSLSTKMYEDMTASLYESNNDENVKIVCIKGTGDFFTAGNDISSLVEAFQNQTPIMEMGFAKFTRALIDSKKPVVAVVNGHAIGIGVTMLSHCEAVYASDKATFNTPFIKLGIPPECCSSYMLPKIMGHAKAGEMLHFNSTFSAQEAYDCNLVTKVIPASKLESETSTLLLKMAEHPLQSLMNSKELLRSRERELLHEVHKKESSNVDVNLVAQAVMKFMSRK